MGERARGLVMLLSNPLALLFLLSPLAHAQAVSGVAVCAPQTVFLSYSQFRTAQVSATAVVMGLNSIQEMSIIVEELIPFAGTNIPPQTLQASIGTLTQPDFYIPKFPLDGSGAAHNVLNPTMHSDPIMIAMVSISSADPVDLSTLTQGELLIHLCGKVIMQPPPLAWNGLTCTTQSLGNPYTGTGVNEDGLVVAMTPWSVAESGLSWSCLTYYRQVAAAGPPFPPPAAWVEESCCHRNSN